MKYYKVTKNYNPMVLRNIEEDEQRNERPDILNLNSINTNIKSIHNKAKDYR